MYVPRHFQVTDPSEIEAFIAVNSFAILVSVIDGLPFATHLPLVFDRTMGEHGAILGHVARANPHWKAFDGSTQALAIFQGPHAYISPAWYEKQPAVPTWNYAAVHVSGAPRLMTDGETAAFVTRLTAVHEAATNPGAPYLVPDATRDGLLKAIVGFVMPVGRIEAKYKLSQNRVLEDQEGVVAHLPADDALAALMVRTSAATSA